MLRATDEQLRLFLRDFVSSYEELEALLFLARNAERGWSGAEVAATLNANTESIDAGLEGLAANGALVEVAQRSGVLLYRFAPSDDATRQQVVELERAYEERRLSVVQMMSGNALERVRSAAMRRLADAFRIERGKK